MHWETILCVFIVSLSKAVFWDTHFDELSIVWIIYCIVYPEYLIRLPSAQSYLKFYLPVPWVFFSNCDNNCLCQILIQGTIDYLCTKLWLCMFKDYVSERIIIVLVEFFVSCFPIFQNLYFYLYVFLKCFVYVCKWVFCSVFVNISLMLPQLVCIL